MSNYYDAIAKSYDRLHGEEQIRKIKTVLKHIELTSDDWVIDVGCGTGVSFPYFQPHVEYMVGIDPAAQLLYNCKSTKKPQMIHGWGEHLPQRDGLFDVVVCFTAIHNFTDPEKGIKEMIRVSKPSATIVVTVWQPKL